MSAQPERPAILWWLSFADPHRPKGTQFLGACIVGGTTLKDACKNAHIFGCNPGGEVKGTPIHADVVPHIKPRWRRRLLSREEAMAFDAEVQAAMGINIAPTPSR